VRESKDILAGLIGLVLVFIGWWYAFSFTPVDAQQGAVYRIIYIHVPAAASALGLCSLGLLVTSIWGLLKPSEKILQASRSWVEVGLIFTTITLLTGSIWGKSTWGTWWTWDARLTTTFLLAILLLAYLLLYNSLRQGKQRIRICSVLGILICVDVPIIYKSVSWWRTLHQPSSIIEQGGRTMDPAMYNALLLNIFLIAIFSTLLWMIRFKNLRLHDQMTQDSFEGVS